MVGDSRAKGCCALYNDSQLKAGIRIYGGYLYGMSARIRSGCLGPPSRTATIVQATL